jgi:hypothetical protein
MSVTSSQTQEPREGGAKTRQDRVCCVVSHLRKWKPTDSSASNAAWSTRLVTRLPLRRTARDGRRRVSGVRPGAGGAHEVVRPRPGTGGAQCCEAPRTRRRAGTVSTCPRPPPPGTAVWSRAVRHKWGEGNQAGQLSATAAAAPCPVPRTCLVRGVRHQLALLEAALDAPAEERQVEGAHVALGSGQPSLQRTRDTQRACRGCHPVSWWSCRRRRRRRRRERRGSTVTS